MQIERQMTGEVVVLSLEGELDSRSAPQAQSEIAELVPQDGKIVLDLSGTTYLSSAGLRVMLLTYRQAREAGTRLVLAAVPADVLDVMSATGFLDFFTVSDTVQAGLGVLQR